MMRRIMKKVVKKIWIHDRNVYKNVDNCIV